MLCCALLCCRYYVAEGVRLYSQETWKQVMGTSGRSKVATYIDQVGGWMVAGMDWCCGINCV
jgi:hypothetical protein